MAIVKQKNASAVTVFRPDPITGELVAVAEIAAPKVKSDIPWNVRYIVWDDLTQSALTAPMVSMAKAAEAAEAFNGAHPMVMRTIRGIVSPLTRAEMAQLDEVYE